MTDNQPHNTTDIASTRRAFIKTTARLAVITTMTALGIAVTTRRNPSNSNCPNYNHCKNCLIQNTCTLPPAHSLRKSNQRSKT